VKDKRAGEKCILKFAVSSITYEGYVNESVQSHAAAGIRLIPESQVTATSLIGSRQNLSILLIKRKKGLRFCGVPL
jgi:hypothetical protein